MFSFHGGLLWIDWINTQYMHQGEIHDGVHDLYTVIDWFAAAEIKTASVVRQLEEASDEQKANLLRGLFTLRSELRKLADEVAATGMIPSSSVQAINERLAQTIGIWQVLLQANGEQRAVFIPQGTLSQQWQWPLLQSAMEFLTTGNLSRLKACGNHQCIQYYYDTSKNNTRRWCKMETCGNREKARRHYQKKSGGNERE